MQLVRAANLQSNENGSSQFMGKFRREPSTRALRILQVSTYDLIGGAERVAWGLFQAYRVRGHSSWLAVGHKIGNDANVRTISGKEQHAMWSRSSRSHWVEKPRAQERRRSWLRDFSCVLTETGRVLDRWRGIEDFRYPDTWQLLSLIPQRPDIVHCHNLHGGYFDLRALPWLSQQVPLALTLHDAWLLSGHCAHSLDCERWKVGCGHCPDLTLDPAIQRDATAYNWRRKHELFKNSRLHIATPSRWLMQKVEQSMLMTAVAGARIIPNGVDLSIFHPADQQAARSALGIRPQAKVALFAANAVRRNIWKDYKTLREAIALAAERMPGRDILLLALGEDACPERIGRAEVRFVPYQSDPKAVASYYQAADVYLHASRADTFPNSVLEALACGTPVIATAVGGIPEQVEHGRTGMLVPREDSQALACQLTKLLSETESTLNMGRQAAESARQQFDLHRQVDAYLEWYYELLDQQASERAAKSN
jgi:glycosyltransferase involved in cell wall biosynthesis